MENRRFAIIIVVLLMSFALVSAVVFMQSYNTISKSLENSLGDGATDMATLIAAEVHLTDADVERLENLPFKDLTSDVKNKELEAAVGELDYSQDVQCVYVMAPIPENMINRCVTAENKNFYKAAVGTPLNIMWLMDVSTDKEERAYIKTQKGFADYYAEMEHFSILRTYEKDVFRNKKPTYVVATDEYGKYITGYSPLYTSEGTFVGMLGVDIRQGDYVAHKNSAFRSVILSSFIVLFILGMMVMFLYNKYTKADRRAKYADALTMAHNRRYINEILPSHLNRKKFRDAKFLLFMMIDYDKFKDINDTYGHAMGDECLKIMVPAFERVAGRLPGRVSRFGGEEFLGVIGVEDAAQARDVAEDLRTEIGNSDPMGNGIHITISIGAYVILHTEITKATVEESIKIADSNLYKAKDAGRNCVCISYEESTDDGEGPAADEHGERPAADEHGERPAADEHGERPAADEHGERYLNEETEE